MTQVSSSVLVTIGGGSGAGKSTIAAASVRALRGRGASVALLGLDAYYVDRPDLSPDERAQLNFDHPDAIDWPLVRHHLRRLVAGRGIEAPTYDFSAHRRTGTITITGAPVVLLEGLHALRDPFVRSVADLRVYVTAPEAVRLDRRRRRDLAERSRSDVSVIEQFDHTVRPAHRSFVGPTIDHADLVLSGTDSAEASAATLIDRLVGTNTLDDGMRDRRGPR